MTIADMHTAVKLELDKSSALELPAFEPEEIDDWLNNAIRKFVKTRYSRMNPKKESFEESQKRSDDLKPLVVNYQTPLLHSEHSTLIGPYALTTTSVMKDNVFGLIDGTSYVIDTPGGYSWPSNHWFTLSERCDILANGIMSRVGVIECTADELEQKLEDPFSEHIVHYGRAKPIRIFNANDVELITDSTYTVLYYYLTYLRAPATVQVTATAVSCDLPEHTHDEIVKLAVSMMLESIEQPRYQTYQNEVITME